MSGGTFYLEERVSLLGDHWLVSPRALSGTRVPADCQVLQLINRPAASKPNGEAKDGQSLEEKASKVQLNENNPDEWGEFLHLPGQKFHDFHKIRDEIVRDTEKMTGKNAGEFGCTFNRVYDWKIG